MTNILLIFIIIDVAYVIYLILSEQKTTPVFCSSNADDPMTQDDKKDVEQASEHSSLTGTEQTEGWHTKGLADKVGEIEKEFAQVSAALQEKAKNIGGDALDLLKHPSHYAELGASLAESMAGESVGEIVGASLGTVFGPEGTLIGAEVGGMAGEVFGARQGGEIAKKLLHHTGTEPPLKEDLQKEGSAKVSGHAGKMIGGMIGDALFDDVGGEIGEAVGDKIGKLAGMLAFEHVEKMHIENNDELPADDVSQTDKDAAQDEGTGH